MPKGQGDHGRRLRKGEKLAILAAVTNQGLSQNKVAKIFEVNRATVTRIVKDPRLTNATDDEIGIASKAIATMMLGSSARAQGFITDRKLSGMNAYQLTLISKINADASQMLQNKPTNIIGHQDVTLTASQMLERLKGRLENVIDAEAEPVE